MTTATVEYAAITHLGRVRTSNQDAIVVDGWATQVSGARLAGHRSLADGQRLALVVVDGMGGYTGGEIAALVTAHALSAEIAALTADESSAWATCFDRANAAVRVAAQADRDYREMGATAAAMVLTGDRLSVVNVGDCRVYRYLHGYLTQLSVDDRMSDPRRPGASLVTQAVGRLDAAPAETHHLSVPLEPGTVLVACSDGLHDAVPDATMQQILERDQPVTTHAEALLTAALEAGAPDNVSLIVARAATPG